MRLFVAAEAREFDGLMRKVQPTERLEWPLDFARRGVQGGEAALFVANGPGPQLAAEAVRVAGERERLTSVVSIGFCGGLNPTLEPDDIFVATEVLGVG